jgi:phosphoglycolate phosphatase-like HAD superfamily hydrolase
MTGEVLAGWKEGATKSAIVDFVARVTRNGSADFVPAERRIAVFDNDGTLWCEKPMPIQFGFLMMKLAEQARKDPSLAQKQPWKAIVEKDHKWLGGVITKHYGGDDSDLKLMAGGLLGAYASESVESFAAKAGEFLRTAKNDALKRPYLQTTYAPMRELLDYLASHGFTNYIVSGGGRDFMRPVTQELYGIPPERVVGTTVELEYREENGKPMVYHTPKLEVFDDGPTKVVRIWSRIGARPIFAAGNSNGDIEMLRFAAQAAPKGMALLLDHDDNEREIAYTAGAEKALAQAKAEHWRVASVRNDWARVFNA